MNIISTGKAIFHDYPAEVGFFLTTGLSEKRVKNNGKLLLDHVQLYIGFVITNQMAALENQFAEYGNATPNVLFRILKSALR